MTSHDIAGIIDAVARDLAGGADLEVLQQGIVAASVSAVAGAEWAGLTYVTGGRSNTTTFSAPVVVEIDRTQVTVGQGPCVDAGSGPSPVLSGDVPADGRWPRFAGLAEQLGVRSALAIRFVATHASFGALTLYSPRPQAFDARDRRIAGVLATHAAIACQTRGVTTQLEAALAHRDIIGQAKGILMERYKIDDEAAFRRLVAASQAANRKVRDVAAHLARTGEMLAPGHYGG